MVDAWSFRCAGPLCRFWPVFIRICRFAHLKMALFWYFWCTSQMNLPSHPYMRYTPQRYCLGALRPTPAECASASSKYTLGYASGVLRLASAHS